MFRGSFWAAVWIVVFLGGQLSAADYPIVYVRAPRSEGQAPKIPEVKDPIDVEPGTDLVLRMPDGSERVLVHAGRGAVLDPYPTFDGQWVLYAFVHDARPQRGGRRSAHRLGSDIFKVHVATGEKVQLTHGEFTPSEGVADWYSNPQGPQLPPRRLTRHALGYGVYNLGPCPLPDGRFAFTSSRNGWLPTKRFTFPSFQLFVADLADGANVEQIDFRSIGSALHPHVLTDGRIIFSSYESQGLRDQRVWSLWHINPDGTDWMSMLYQNRVNAWHFHSQLSNHDVVCVDYYNQNNWGFGYLVGFPLKLPPGKTGFGSQYERQNEPLVTGLGTDSPWKVSYPFKRDGLYALTPWTLPNDRPAGISSRSGERVGKVTHPAGAPDGILVTYSRGGVNGKGRAEHYPDAGIYLIPENRPTQSPDELLLVVDKPEYHEQQARALVPYRDIYGVDEPAALPWLPDSQHPLLPDGTPFGLVGSSTVYLRETAVTDVTTFTGDDVYYIRYLLQQPNPHLARGPASRQFPGFSNGINERLWILGEVPVRNKAIDPMGNPDTSHLVRIPANISFMQQLLDKDRQVLTNSWTWKQVRPGETITKCGGCHFHSQPGLPFEQTYAATDAYQVHDLTRDEPTIYTYEDVQPIFEEKCQSCHAGPDPAADLVLDESVADNTRVIERFASIKSELIKRVRGISDGKKMPLKGPPLTPDEILTLVRWIDTGATVGPRARLWPTKPTLHVESPDRFPAEPVREVVVGAFAYGGVRVDVSAPVLAALVSENDGVYRYRLERPLPSGEITVVATDRYGNTQRIVRRFEVTRRGNSTRGQAAATAARH